MPTPPSRPTPTALDPEKTNPKPSAEAPRLLYRFHSKPLVQRLLANGWHRLLSRKSLLSLGLSLLTALTLISAHVLSTPTLTDLVAHRLERLTIASPPLQTAYSGLADETRSAVGQPGSSLHYLGHFAYAQAQVHQLMVISSYSRAGQQRFEQLRPDAALALMKLIDAARADGVWIVPISAFRNYHRQGELFKAQIAQRGSEQAAARSVAPPGFSEHHTGYAVDLADGLARATDVAYSFGDTSAFRWLQANASNYGYQLSFPPDNPQGVNYEPWHWRFIQSPQAALTFSKSG